MLKIAILAAVGAAAIAPAAASAQALPGAIVAVVDLDRVSSECNACKTASAALRSQQAAFESRRNALAGPIQTEQKSIQTAIDALGQGKAPDAALQARIKAWETRQQQANADLQRQAEQLQRNGAYVSEQIRNKLNTVYTPVMQRRGANIIVEQGATLASAASLDVTNDVLAALNAALPSVSTTAPAVTAPTTRQQQPQGR